MKEKWIYSSCGITFDGTGSWNFNNDYARNDIIFVLIIVHHLIMTVLVLGDCLMFGTDGSFERKKEKMFIIKRITRSLNIACKNKTEVFVKYYLYLN